MIDLDLLARFQRVSHNAAPDDKPVIAAARALAQILQQAETAQATAAELEQEAKTGDASDAELAALAEEEAKQLLARAHAAEQALAALLAQPSAQEGGLVLEIRPGTGGEEASLFAGDLARMYQRYAAKQGWKFEILSSQPGGNGTGLREFIACVSGAGAHKQLPLEAGVHRVQRVPATEARGRIHTSAASVAVLPEPQAHEIEIPTKDLRVDVFRASGPGGQSVNTTDSAVRITHLPSGITVSQQDEKSQHRNRAKAMQILRARLYEQQQAESHAARAAQRAEAIGSGDRSERVRTYNFPQNRVSDHRINFTLRKLTQILAGEALQEIIDPLMQAQENQWLDKLPQSARDWLEARGA